MRPQPLSFLNRFAGGLLLCACALAGNAADVEPLASAAPYSDLMVTTPDQRIHVLDDYRGRVVVINFWASWCPPCLREFPSLVQLKKELEGLPFDILAVNVAEGAGTVRRFAILEEDGLRLLMDRDGTQSRVWQVEYYPTSFILDTEGRLRYRIEGEMDWTGAEPMAWVQSLLPDPSRP